MAIIRDTYVTYTSKMAWTNDVVLEFVELYKREQVLWDPKHPLHRNRNEVADAWLRIQSSLSINVSVTDLKKKKESLMTAFRLHWKKKRTSQDGYHTTWFAYALMESFLGGKYECDSTNEIEHEIFVNTSAYNTPQAISDHKYTSEKRTPVGKQTKQIVSQASANLYYAKKRMDEAVNYLKKAADGKTQTDEYDLYCQLLAKKLRKLDERQRDVAMHEIDNIMYRAKMQSGSTHSRSYSSSPSPVHAKVKSPVFIAAQQIHPNFEDETIHYEDHNIS